MDRQFEHAPIMPQRCVEYLRPAPGKRAVVYELVTRATVDERLARSRDVTARSDEGTRHDLHDGGGADAAAL